MTARDAVAGDLANASPGGVPVAGPDAAELVARAKALVPVLRERAAQAERDRRLPRETLAEIHRAGILKVLQPKKFGGLESDYVVFSDIIQELAQGCGSSAWVYSVLGEHKWVIAMYPEQAQLEVWGEDSNAASCASFAPAGSAEQVAGGHRLNGRWSFASGCDHAQWAIIGSMVKQKEGALVLRDFLIPMHELTIDDDWHVLGLNGTGSKSLLAKDVFVPDHRSVSHAELFAGTTAGRQVHEQYHLCRAPRGLMASFTLISVLVGLSRRAVDVYAEMTAGRVSRGIRIAESDAVQLKLAEAAAESDTARMLVRTVCEANIRALKNYDEITLEQRVRTRRDMVFAAKLARQAADRVFSASGGHSLYDSAPMQAIFRDVLAASSHLFINWELGAAPYGQFRLGIPVDSPFI